MELYTDSGHEVAIHGKQHLSLPEVSYAVATDEVLNDRIALEEMFGTMVTGLAYANGAYDDKTVEILKNCGVEYARTIIATESFAMPTDWLRLPTTCHHSHPKLMELARTFVEHEPRAYYWSRTPMLFYLWGHSYEFNNEDEWQSIEEFAEYMGNREEIWYATNIEICHYVKAFESLQFSAQGDKVYNPSATDVYLNYFGKKILVEAGERVDLK